MATIEVVVDWTAVHKYCGVVLDWQDGAPFCHTCNRHVYPYSVIQVPDLDVYISYRATGARMKP